MPVLHIVPSFVFFVALVQSGFAFKNLTSRASVSISSIPFADVSAKVGFVQPSNSDQFGGAAIADLDGDGHYDFFLTYHNTFPMRLFYGTARGTFTRSLFSVKSDIHGVSVAFRTARSSERIIAVSVGGGRGVNLRAPLMFLAKKDRSITTITDRLGFGKRKGRGRVGVFMDMSLQSSSQSKANLGGPDVLFVNLLGVAGNLKHFAYQNVKGNYRVRDVPGFATVNEERAIVTDVDNDGVMELVHFSDLRIFKLVRPFTFRDVTSNVWPGRRSLSRSISAVVELDINNDGRMDLYLARAQSSLVTRRGPPSVPERADVLLLNTGGKYTDISRMAGVPTNTDSMGVTAEDFNNDGFVDLLITTYTGPDIILLNRGNNSFKKINAGTSKSSSRRGANVMAVDYDLDGRVDYIAGQLRGNYRLMKNQMKLTSSTNYLLVRVGSEPTFASTSLNAIVKVSLSGGQTLVRRVGGRGAQKGGVSYIDTVHFGLGRVSTVRAVTVSWTKGGSQVKRGVKANQKISFGRFN